MSNRYGGSQLDDVIAKHDRSTTRWSGWGRPRSTRWGRDHGDLSDLEAATSASISASRSQRVLRAVDRCALRYEFRADTTRSDDHPAPTTPPTGERDRTVRGSQPCHLRSPPGVPTPVVSLRRTVGSGRMHGEPSPQPSRQDQGVMSTMSHPRIRWLSPGRPVRVGLRPRPGAHADAAHGGHPALARTGGGQAHRGAGVSNQARACISTASPTPLLRAPLALPARTRQLGRPPRGSSRQCRELGSTATQHGTRHSIRQRKAPTHGGARLTGAPNGIRTRATALKGRRPGPLDDEGVSTSTASSVRPQRDVRSMA